MLVALAYCLRDQEITFKLFDWIKELIGCQKHSLLLCHDARCPESNVAAISKISHECFETVHEITAKAEIDGWPAGANYMFQLCATWASYQPSLKYFLWIEPDAIPLKTGWLDAIEADYLMSKKPFMGDRVEVADVPLHMSGVAVYCNPVINMAGEAMRCHDVAWDIAAKDQIVHRAHWTKLIEHAWKHPTFTDPQELSTQIRPEAVLFHASKDGSLISLLEQQRSGSRAATNISTPGGENPPPLTENLGAVRVAAEQSPDTEQTAGLEPAAVIEREGKVREVTGNAGENRRSRGGAQISCDIFIRTYAQDYPWLEYCLQSIHKFASGFRKIVIVSPHGPPMVGNWDMHDVEWKVLNEESEDGYLSQQIHKLYADVITDYQPEYILHIDSDVILTQPITPQTFFTGDKITWYYTPYEAIETPWQPVTEKFMRKPVANEFMRRLPIMIPRWLYANLREYCYSNHGKRIISEYIRNQPPREFSEFNALGAFAYEQFTDRFEWVNTKEEAIPGPVARQFHSWGGVTPEIKSEIQTILNAAAVLPEPNTSRTLTSEAGVGEAKGESPKRESISGLAHQPETVAYGDSRGGVQKIKVLPNDIWVIEGDSISEWVEQEGRLDHDQNLLPKILPYIHEGDTVIDAGAFIGDHTIAYAKAVGKKGLVYAFEPNPIAYQCLVHNVRNLKHVISTDGGLSDRRELVSLNENNGNYGGCYVGEGMPVSNVLMWPLDQDRQWGIEPNFIKIDVEGYELKVLRGAEQTIGRCRPTMVIEINYGALKRQGDRSRDIFDWLWKHGYDWRILQENCCLTSDLYDILAQPRKGGDATCVQQRNSVQKNASKAAPKVQASGAAEYGVPEFDLSKFEPGVWPDGMGDIVKVTKENREALIANAVKNLKVFCTSPVHTSQVRKELKRQKVIRST